VTELTKERVLELFDVDIASGIFRRKTNISQTRVGDIAGWTSKGYRILTIDGRRYRAHKVIWFLATGEWPVGELDHKDRVRNNNGFSNLRKATPSQNKRNMGLRSINTSGYKGVSRHCQGRWMAMISNQGKQTYIGLFDTAEEAAIAYNRRALELSGEFAVLNPVEL